MFVIALCLPIGAIGFIPLVTGFLTLFARDPFPGLFTLLASIPLLGLGWLGILLARDLLLPRPLLVIDDEGILDRRLDCGIIAWSEIEAIHALHPIAAGLLIRLAHPKRAKFSPLRPGTLGVIWKLPPSTVYVSMQSALGPHIAIDDIEKIANTHGVTIQRTAIG